MHSEKPLRIFVLIDALGWKLLDGRTFLAAWLPFRKPLRTVLGYSSAAIPSILTGLLPSQHGRWALFYRDPQHAPFRWLRHLCFLPARILDSRVSRKVIKEIGQHLLSLGPSFECCVSPHLLPYFNVSETKNIYAPAALAPTTSIFDDLVKAKIEFRV
jgi:hypothetical protein